MRASAVYLLFIAAIAAGAQTPDLPFPGSAALVEDATEWDGRTVGFRGEAVGESMRRGDMAWIHLNDDAYGLEGTTGLSGFNSGIGVWIRADLGPQISDFGGYARHGDVVEITGTFNAACPLHGGDLDIHADSIRVVRRGSETTHPVNGRRAIAAAAMAAMTLVFFLAVGMRRRRDTVDGGRKS